MNTSIPPAANTTGSYSLKRYRCTACGHESLIGTNHWGECYPRCSNCGWKRPLESGQVHECLEPVPEGYAKAEPEDRAVGGRQAGPKC